MALEVESLCVSSHWVITRRFCADVRTISRLTSCGQASSEASWRRRRDDGEEMLSAHNGSTNTCLHSHANLPSTPVRGVILRSRGLDLAGGRTMNARTLSRYWNTRSRQFLKAKGASLSMTASAQTQHRCESHARAAPGLLLNRNPLRTLRFTNFA